MVMTYTQISLGEYLSNRRRAKGLTQLDIVNKLAAHGYKYGETVVSQWEKNRAMPPIHDPMFVKALAGILDIKPREILEAVGFDPDDVSSVPQWLTDFLNTATPDELRMMRVFLETLKKSNKDSK